MTTDKFVGWSILVTEEPDEEELKSIEDRLRDHARSLGFEACDIRREDRGLVIDYYWEANVH